MPLTPDDCLTDAEWSHAAAAYTCKYWYVLHTVTLSDGVLHHCTTACFTMDTMPVQTLRHFSMICKGLSPLATRLTGSNCFDTQPHVRTCAVAIPIALAYLLLHYAILAPALHASQKYTLLVWLLSSNGDFAMHEGCARHTAT